MWCLEPSTLVLTYEPSFSSGAAATPMSELGPRDILKFTMDGPPFSSNARASDSESSQATLP